MKEQARLREEMAYQYKLGNFEVNICLRCEFQSFYYIIVYALGQLAFIGRRCYSEKIGPRPCYVKLLAINWSLPAYHLIIQGVHPF